MGLDESRCTDCRENGTSPGTSYPRSFFDYSLHQLSILKRTSDSSFPGTDMICAADKSSRAADLYEG
jgi:hypothetical protein